MSKMRPIWIIAVILSLVLSACLFFGCGPTEEENKATEGPVQKIVSVANAFNVEQTNGYTYTVEQTLAGTVVNSKEITLRLYRDENGQFVRGQRVEKRKSLNEDFEGDQFSTEEETLYFDGGVCYRYADGVKEAIDRSYESFSALALSLFGIKDGDMQSVEMKMTEKTASLKFGILDADAAAILGVPEGSVRNLTFSLTILIQEGKLTHFEMSYDQNRTSTKIKCDPYYKNLPIVLPRS